MYKTKQCNKIKLNPLSRISSIFIHINKTSPSSNTKNTTFYPTTHFSLLYSPFVNMIFTTYLFVHNLYLPFSIYIQLKTSSSPEHLNKIKNLMNKYLFNCRIIRILHLHPFLKLVLFSCKRRESSCL